jgi:hypothetical protein
MLIASSCKKGSDTTTPTTQSTIQWSLSGTSYIGASSSYFLSSLLALDANRNYVSVDFNSKYYTSTSRPVAASYTVLKYGGTATAANQCVVEVGNQASTTPYYSTGKMGDVVTISLSSTGKLIASFTNITVSDGTTTKTVSGTIQEQ